MLLLDMAVRSSIVLIAGLGLSALLRKQPASLRHAVLAMSLFSAAALVPLTAIVPEWTVPWPAFAQWSRTSPHAAASVQDQVVLTASAETPWRPTAIDAAAVLWLAGLTASAIVLLTGYTRLLRIARRARTVESGDWVQAAGEVGRAYGLRGPVAILHTDASDMLATFGAWRPRVLLPAQATGWSEDRIRAVLSHELAHVRRHDWLVQMGAEALRCVYWFNPLAWIACARLRSESEYACDDAVLQRGMSARDYATHLVELARVCRPPRASLSAMPMARASTLERRITVMLNPTVNRRPVSWRTCTAAALLLASIALPAAALRAGQQTSPATLTGSVYDPTGGVMPGVTLTLQDDKDGKWNATTSAAGRFEFPSIAPGQYVLEAKLPGFRTFRQEVTLRTARDWDRALTLQVGELTETIFVEASRVTATGPSQPQPTRLKVGGNIRVPRKLHDVKPVYPVSMREAGREGLVPLEAIIGTDGSVTSVRVLSADVHPDFAIAASDAVRQWRFDPTLLNGAPVEVRMAVSIEFKLAD